MLAIRNVLRITSILPKNVNSVRNMSATCIPARKDVSRGEAIVLAGMLFFGWTSIPAYVLVNMKHYTHRV